LLRFGPQRVNLPINHVERILQLYAFNRARGLQRGHDNAGERVDSKHETALRLMF
jgi:hypothetical protein